ncbi:MAG: hypothetical protein KDB06_10415 [Ilumatobacter sp.]|nr:hypothetical protein [Ilumatobacter sp.]
MVARLVALGMDALDPPGLAAFWAAALRWDVRAGGDGSTVVVEPTDGTPFPLVLSRVAQAKAGQNRNHLDLNTVSLQDQRGTVEELLALGGRHADVGQGPDETHVVLADPEGNELCIIEPTNNFLSSCGRMGAINCDGTRAVGVFWSEVFGWPLVWDQDEETAIRVPGPTGPMITWSGPPLMPKHGKNRLCLHIAPEDGQTVDELLERLVARGASRLDAGPTGATPILMADPDGNEFLLVEHVT